jgi:subtilase family protein/VCBS repeat protein
MMLNSDHSRLLILLFVLLAAIFSAQSIALAENPDWPNAPDQDPRDAEPDDPGFSGKWNLISYIPDAALGTIRPEEIDLGSGIHADRAWQVTTGSSEVVIAVLDSGIKWDSWELVNKFYINKGEVPLPDGASEHDANGDGVFDIRDYAGDPRVYDANTNGHIEPGDLIRIFSDGIDDDGNGYIDDISGWDFFQQDNDPADDNRYGHGTSEANWSGAEANNGGGNIGVCPECRILMVRVADSFIGDENQFAQGAIFSVDSGALVIQEALGTLNATSFGRDAIQYAVENGVSIAASAADENSFHHNYPASHPRTIHVNNIVRDRDDYAEVTSFMAMDACTNWGPKITVGASSCCCSSGATGVLGGALGLIYSRAVEIDLDPPLSADEVFSIVTASATDIYDARGETKWWVYNTRPGWDKYFGHGRLNLRDAVDRVTPDTIPPEAYIDSPEWFETVDRRTLYVPIRGYVDARRAASFSYRLYAASGLSPEDSDWRLIGRRRDLTAPLDGALGLLGPSKLSAQKAIKRDATEDNAILLKLIVSDSNGNQATYFHSFFLYSDPDWADGFPMEMGGGGESPTLMADMTDDGIYELIVPTSDGWVHAFTAGGDEIPGWPVATDAVRGQSDYLGSEAYVSGALSGDRYQSIIGAPAAADIDDDGETEVVVTSVDGGIYAWGPDGMLEPGFPVYLDPANTAPEYWSMKLEYGVLGAPLLVNLDDDPDGTLEIVVGAMDQWVYAWHYDGTEVSGWPVLCRATGQGTRIVSSPAAGDINGDGRIEILIGTNERPSDEGRIYAIDAAGNDGLDGPILPGWPAIIPTLMGDYLPLVGDGVASSPALADFDGDGQDEVVISAGVGASFIFDGDGTQIRQLGYWIGSLVNGTNEIIMGKLNSNYAIADLDGQGRLMIITGGVGGYFGLQLAFEGLRVPSEALVGAWYADTGKSLRYWPQPTEGIQLTNAHTVADLDNDGLPEVITGSAGHYVHAYDFNGKQPAGWPKFTGGWIIGAPSVGDMDGDGLLEVATTTREGKLFVWDTEGNADGNIQWTSFSHDARNTGNYGTELPVQDGPLP